MTLTTEYAQQKLEKIRKEKELLVGLLDAAGDWGDKLNARQTGCSVYIKYANKVQDPMVFLALAQMFTKAPALYESALDELEILYASIVEDSS